MYSENGRKKTGKETAHTTDTVKKLICDDCGFIEQGRFKEFGELLTCSKCNSLHVRLTNRDE